MSDPLRLECPACDGKVLYYLKRAGTYRCRRCGSEFRITKISKGIRYNVVYSPLTTVKVYEKSTIKKPKINRR